MDTLGFCNINTLIIYYFYVALLHHNYTLIGDTVLMGETFTDCTVQESFPVNATCDEYLSESDSLYTISGLVDV